MPQDPSAAVVGTGFVAALHVDALRRLGVEVRRRRLLARARAGEALAPVYESFDAALADDCDVVHVTSGLSAT